MLKLLKKDFALAMHPVTPFFLLLSAMVLIPNYPYSVALFYTGLSLFFTCLSGRENKDVHYSMMLPVSKREIVRARFAFAVVLQIAQCVLMLALGVIQQRINPLNAAGMEPNVAFAGWGLIVFAVFNAVFFEIYYRNVEKVGFALCLSAVPVFVMIGFEIVATYAIPIVRDVLDTKDPAYMGEKMIFLGIGIVIYSLSTWLSLRRAERNFEKQDV